MRVVNYVDVQLGDVLSELEDRGEISCIGGEEGLKRRLEHPIIEVYATERNGEGRVVFVREGQAGPVMAVFSSTRKAAFNWNPRRDKSSTPTFLSTMDIFRLAGKLKGLMREYCEGIRTIHASLVAINGRGVLLTGPSGVGKTSCAWSLIRRGHRLVSDDAVITVRTKGGDLVGRAPSSIRGYIHLREKGILRLAEEKLIDEVPISVSVSLVREGVERQGKIKICGVPIPQIILKRGAGRKFAGRIEQIIAQ